MSKIPRIRAATIAFSMLWGTTAPAAADEYYEGVDINQRVIDGERQPINTYLLKRRAATKPDPGATGTINRPVQPPAKRPATPAQP